MRVHGVAKLDAPMKELVRLEVIRRIARQRGRVVILFGKEPRGPEHDDGQPVVEMDKLAERLGRGLGHAIDVLRHGRDLLGDPGGRSTRGRDQGTTEGARRAGEDEAAHLGRDSLLEQVERPGDVGVHELLPRMGGHMGLMQRGRVDDRARARAGSTNEILVDDRPDDVSVLRLEHIEADHVMAVGAETPNERLAEVPRASSDEDALFHDRNVSQSSHSRTPTDRRPGETDYGVIARMTTFPRPMKIG